MYGIIHSVALLQVRGVLLYSFSLAAVARWQHWHFTHDCLRVGKGTVFGAIMLQGPIGLAYGTAVGTTLGTASGLLWKASEYILPPVRY